MRISDEELAWRTFHAIERLNAVLYLQRVVRHPGHDLRVFVLRGTSWERCAGMHSRANGAPTCRWGEGPSLAGWIRRRSGWHWLRPERSGRRWPAST